MAADPKWWFRFAQTLCLTLGIASDLSVRAQPSEGVFETGRFSWTASAPLIDVGSGKGAPDPHIAIKDPSVVFAEGRWHMFATVRMKSGKVDIEYLNFTDWAQAEQAPRYVLALHDQYYCAPQVFYFTPHRKWYLIYQLADRSRSPAFGPCVSTGAKIDDPKSWSPPRPMVTNAPANPKWLDFWVICDDTKAHMFYTSLDGHMWRRETSKRDFPFGWSEPQLALAGDIFEASHTYRLRGRAQYLTMIEAQGQGRRYFKAYVAHRLEGPWRPLADTLAKPFAAYSNVRQNPEWTANISHGELLRTGVDELMEIDPEHLRCVFQGANDTEYHQNYGSIPWRLGLLEMK